MINQETSIKTCFNKYTCISYFYLHLIGTCFHLLPLLYEFRNFKRLVRNKATETPLGDVLYIQPILYPVVYKAIGVRNGYYINYIGVGLWRCSFRLIGQCEGLNTWNE